MSRVYIVNAKRSPIGKFLGSLSEISIGDLASQVIKDLLEKSDIEKNDIDEVILGNVLSAGHGQGIARQAAIRAGIPDKVPAYTLNMVCGSGMKSIMNAYTQIKSKLADIVIAGGVEIMSQAPFVFPYIIRSGKKMGDIKMLDTILVDGLLDSFNNYHMGITAENIVGIYNISREAQDLFAINSQKKTIKSIDEGKFIDEIVPIHISDKNDTIVFDCDEYPNRTTNYEKISKLKPAFKANGTITAGNSSGINDGAAALILVSEQAVNKYNLKPMAEIISIGQGGLDPSIMGMGPVVAIKDALSKADVSFKDIDLVELNEAFAAQSIGVLEELKMIYNIDEHWIKERVNVNGGAISLGHPLGASGSRIVTTLVHEMNRRESLYGLASLCIGGGMGTAILLKRV